MDHTRLLSCMENWDAARDLVTPFCTHQPEFRLAAIRAALQTTVWAEQLFEAALAEEHEVTHLQALLQLGTNVKTMQLFHRIVHRCAQQAQLLEQLWQTYPKHHEAQIHSCIKYGQPQQLVQLWKLGATARQVREEDLDYLGERLEEAQGAEREELWRQLLPLHDKLKQVAWDKQLLSLLCWLGKDNSQPIDCSLLHDVLSAAGQSKSGPQLDCLRLMDACDLSRGSGHSRELLMVAAVRAGQQEVVSRLKLEGFSIDSHPEGTDSPVEVAVQRNDPQMLELLLRLEARCDPFPQAIAPAQPRLSALQQALSQPGLTQRRELVDLLLQYGADPMLCPEGTLAPLLQTEDPELQYLLKEYGATLPEPAPEARCHSCLSRS